MSTKTHDMVCLNPKEQWFEHKSFEGLGGFRLNPRSPQPRDSSAQEVIDLKCGSWPTQLAAQRFLQIIVTWFARVSSRGIGSSHTGCFKPGGVQFVRGSALLRSFAPFCALLCSFADLRLRSLVLICALLRSFACLSVWLCFEQWHLGTAGGNPCFLARGLFVRIGPESEKRVAQIDSLESLCSWSI